MEPKEEKNNQDEFPSIPSNDLEFDNPYKDIPEEKEKQNIEVKRVATALIDPDKGNISDQLGLEFDYPSETNLFGNSNKNENDNNINNINNENPFETNNNQINDNNNVNENKFMNNFDSPPKPDNMNNNNNNNYNFNNNFNNNNNPYGNNFNNNNNYNNNYQPQNNYNNNNFNNNNNNYNNFNNNYNNYNNFNNNNNNYNNYNNNNYNNFNNNNNNYNNYNNNNNNYSNNNNINNNDDQNLKKIQKMISLCETKFTNAINQFKNYQIIESKKGLNNLISFLFNLEKTIKEKNQIALSLLPNIDTLRNNILKKLYEYNYWTYTLNLSLFQNLVYQKNFDLAKYAQKFILTTPFITFNDIYDTTTDPNKPTRNALLEIYERAQRSGYKTLFLYGPKGSGKTLHVHALAAELGAVVGQFDSLRNLKVQYLVKEFARLITEYNNRPIIVFIKDVEYLVKEGLGEILFLHDKFNSEKRKVLFICSSQYPLRTLPPQLKFKYVYLINSANQSNKYNLFKFLAQKFGIKVSMSDSDLSNFVYQNLKNYSNLDVFNVIKVAMDLKKQSGENVFDISRSDLEKAVKLKKGSLDEQCMQYYHL